MKGQWRNAAVAEHRIRLRGGWEWFPADSPGAAASRLTLPISWESDRPRRLRLTRRFNRPPLDAESRMVLLLEQVPGITSLALNGHAVARVSPGESHYEIPLGSLPERNELVLEVEIPRSAAPAGCPTPEWGAIALVIRTAPAAD
jgi:hypothetical protein